MFQLRQKDTSVEEYDVLYCNEVVGEIVFTSGAHRAYCKGKEVFMDIYCQQNTKIHPNKKDRLLQESCKAIKASLEELGEKLYEVI